MGQEIGGSVFLRAQRLSTHGGWNEYRSTPTDSKGDCRLDRKSIFCVPPGVSGIPKSISKKPDTSGARAVTETRNAHYVLTPE